MYDDRPLGHRGWRRTSLVILAALVLPVAAVAADPDSSVSRAILVSHGDKGFEFAGEDGRFLLQIQARGQFRYGTPSDSDPESVEELQTGTRHDLELNRARLKVGGHAYQPWLEYYYEYELSNSNLLDFRVMVERHPFAMLKVGQWKVQYNRERAISSGAQQMSERSIITPPFTLDRQQGVSLYGHLKGRGAADFNYWLSVFSGTGQQMKGNDDAIPMWMARAQWNPLGRSVPWHGSDVHFTEAPALLIAFAGATNRSPYTRFSQNGGGQLPGFAPGVDGQYDVKQWVEETAFMWRGFSWQQEFHRKHVGDRVDGVTTTLMGNYAQAGYLFHDLWASVPPQLELAVRHAWYDPDVDIPDDEETELGIAANWFIDGHLNKLTAEVRFLRFKQPFSGKERGEYFRLQWDVSL